MNRSDTMAARGRLTHWGFGGLGDSGREDPTVWVQRTWRGHRRARGSTSARAFTVALSAILATAALAVRVSPVRAAGYDNTNPGATICGDGSHTVYTLRNFYVSYGGLIYAELQVRWSPTCNTVWTRTVNRTGHGNGYATQRQLVSDEAIYVYNCPDTSCIVHSQKEVGDVLPGTDDSGWSHQFVIPGPGSTGSPAAPQPPTVRGIVWIKWSGHSTPLQFDTNLEPTWTWEANGFKNERNLRVNSTVMTCDNTASRCDLAYAVMHYRIDTSVPTIISSDLVNMILPAFSQVNGGPQLVICGGPCSEDVMVYAEPRGGPNIGLAGGMTYQTESTGTPAYLIYQRVYYRNTYYANGSNVAWSHACSEGCTGDNNDDRPVVAHEIGHTVGLGHCDTNSGMSVMCAARSTSATQELDFNGNHYWHPRSADFQALGVMY
jgi:hypothetical protein